MANEAVNQVLDDLDTVILGEYEQYSLELIEYWSNFSGNPGQMTIVQNHILPASQRHIRAARPNWPFSEHPDGYLDRIVNCMNEDGGGGLKSGGEGGAGKKKGAQQLDSAEVIYRAFGDTLQESYERLTEIWLYAESAQTEHAFIAGPENAGPHATHRVWRGNGGADEVDI